MTQNNTKIYTHDEKIKLVAQAIYDNWLLNDSTRFEWYKPPANLEHSNIMDSSEYRSYVNHLEKLNCISQLEWGSGGSTMIVWSVNCSFTLNASAIRKLLQLKDTSTAKVTILDDINTTITIRGKEILLGRQPGQKPLQYWIVKQCEKKPGKAVNELDILEAAGYDMTAPKRTVSDAVRGLNEKINKQTGIKRLFIYGSSRVTFNSQLLK